MLHSDITPEHCCDGEPIPLQRSTEYLRFVRCSSCGTKFTYLPDCDWVTMVLPWMKSERDDL
jgi:hypothetical protein